MDCFVTNCNAEGVTLDNRGRVCCNDCRDFLDTPRTPHRTIREKFGKLLDRIPWR